MNCIISPSLSVYLWAYLDDVTLEINITIFHCLMPERCAWPLALCGGDSGGGFALAGGLACRPDVLFAMGPCNVCGGVHCWHNWTPLGQ